MGKKQKGKKVNLLNNIVDAATVVVNALVDKSQKNAKLPTDLKHCGIILQRHSTIKELYELSGTNAKSNEFQMHYWMLVFRHTFQDGGFFDVAIPTCYFNYEQFVSAAHVDFEMKDVSELSAKIEPLHNMITNQILATSFQTSLEAIFGLPFEPLSVDVGTLHRHPGSSSHQRFSGTDLDANKTHHGIVFPLKSGVDKPSFSGILAIDAGECNVAHYEYRIVNGSYDTDDMTYTKGRCLAITKNDTFVPPVLSSIEQFFGVRVTTPSPKIKEDSNVIPHEYITALDSLIDLLPKANTQLIRSENVKTKVVTTVYGNGYYGAGWKSPTIKPYQLDVDAYEYNLYVLRNSLERHYEYAKIPFKVADLYKLTKPEIEKALKEVYIIENEAEATKTKGITTPSKKTDATKIGQFIICEIGIRTEDTLTSNTREELIAHYDELDTYYYGKVAKSIGETDIDITKAELIEQIIELYVNIYDEEQDTLKNENLLGVVTQSGDTGDIDGTRDFYDYYYC